MMETDQTVYVRVQSATGAFVMVSVDIGGNVNVCDSAGKPIARGAQIGSVSNG